MSASHPVKQQLSSCFKRRKLCGLKSTPRTINASLHQDFPNASHVQIRNVASTTSQRVNHNVSIQHNQSEEVCGAVNKYQRKRSWPRATPTHCFATQHNFSKKSKTGVWLYPSFKRWLISTIPKPVEYSLKSRGNMHRAVVAFGSNIGDRVTHIENALSSMRTRGIKIVKLSRLYETSPMYYHNQDSFMNGAVLVETDLSPIALLDELQQIETEHGRRREIAKGPRTLDLDIILYGDELIDVERLKVPHPGILEREFVLRPLSDIIPYHNFKPLSNSSSMNGAVEIKSALTAITNRSEPMYPITQFSSHFPPLFVSWPNRRTRLMSILNITPDSFSDGGVLSPSDLDTVTHAVRSHICNGATILDIGGQSTRPDASFLSASEELSRVLPVLHHIKQMPEAKKVAISLDTFHADVAKTCAAEDLIDIINDVSAGQMDENMLRVMAGSRKTVVLMHMRGTPSTMTKLTDYPDGVVRGVANELSQRVIEALDAGIPPWRIILDPGIGFAKTLEQNLELLRAGTDGIVKERPDVLSGYPWLVGTSRKGFIGKITGVKEARERVWGTAACVTAAVAGGVDVVRVHDVKEMEGVVMMADAIYRGGIRVRDL